MNPKLNYLTQDSRFKILVLGLIMLIILTGCKKDDIHNEIIDRKTKIPQTAVKMNPENDPTPPIMHSDEFAEPKPLSETINTAGAEDSPFITGNKLYFFFTPDLNIPAEKQLVDKVTGIYESTYDNGTWAEPERVVLSEPGEDTLDGCEVVHGINMMFCSARAGGYRDIDIYAATFIDGKWEVAELDEDLNLDIQAGEVHFNPNSPDVYFHADNKEGGMGGRDIWLTRRAGELWTEPINIAAVNTEGDEGWPFVTLDNKELWFTRTYQGTPAIFRSKLLNGEWQTPELIVSQFAGEPNLDEDGNLYFVHHYFKNGQMIEADIFIAEKR